MNYIPSRRLLDWVRSGKFGTRLDPRDCPWTRKLSRLGARWVKVPLEMKAARNACTLTHKGVEILALTRGSYQRQSYLLIRLSDYATVLFYRISNLPVFLDLLADPIGAPAMIGYQTSNHPTNPRHRGDRAIRDDKTIASLVEKNLCL